MGLGAAQPPSLGLQGWEGGAAVPGARFPRGRGGSSAGAPARGCAHIPAVFDLIISAFKWARQLSKRRGASAKRVGFAVVLFFVIVFCSFFWRGGVFFGGFVFVLFLHFFFLPFFFRRKGGI